MPSAILTGEEWERVSARVDYIESLFLEASRAILQRNYGQLAATVDGCARRLLEMREELLDKAVTKIRQELADG